MTPEFRVSFPHVFKAQAPKPTDNPKFSITMLFPKEKELVGEVPKTGEPLSFKKVIYRAKVAKFGPDKADWPEEIQSPYRDGDDKKYADKLGYAGHWAIKAISSEDQRPMVVGRDKQPLEKPADLYPGCYARASLLAYVWEYMGNYGVGFILDHVQKLRDGEAFGGKIPVDQAFSPLDDEEDESEEDEDEKEDEEEDF